MPRYVIPFTRTEKRWYTVAAASEEAALNQLEPCCCEEERQATSRGYWSPLAVSQHYGLPTLVEEFVGHTPELDSEWACPESPSGIHQYDPKSLDPFTPQRAGAAGVVDVGCRCCGRSGSFTVPESAIQW